MLTSRNFPYATFPTGWYQVGWSDELPQGAVTPMRYFATDLVLYRTDTGILRCTDAFCPHLGAHLGYGGRVEGDELVCPFHGWRWNLDGRNCEIPYSAIVNKGKRLKQWHVAEANGMIVVWYDAEGRDPSWTFVDLPEYGTPDYLAPPECRRVWRDNPLHPQFAAENLVDAAHQKFVHGATYVPEITRYEAEGPIFHVHNEMRFGVGRKSTWLTPEGEVTALLRTQAHGLGILLARFDIDNSIHFQTFTPVDDELCDMRATVWLPGKDVDENGKPTEQRMKRFEHECKQVENDLLIWAHMRFERRAPWPPEESRPYQAMRQWATQFYPDADAEPHLAAVAD